jgi:hypothetical protein
MFIMRLDELPDRTILFRESFICVQNIPKVFNMRFERKYNVGWTQMKHESSASETRVERKWNTSLGQMKHESSASETRV